MQGKKILFCVRRAHGDALDLTEVVKSYGCRSSDGDYGLMKEVEGYTCWLDENLSGATFYTILPSLLTR